ncbi:UNVERIFIED_CONTAM: Fe2+-dependent dioxygenase [Euhalothece sp. KZN 001]
MIFQSQQVLNGQELEIIRNLLQDAEFVDGKLSAGHYAQTVKENQQVSKDEKIGEKIREIVNKALERDRLFQKAVRPKTIRSPLINCYQTGMFYGTHMDNAMMKEGNSKIRTDVSLTLFLSNPESYEGGELILETTLGEQSFKLKAGDMIVYPSTLLHRVAEVKSGTRFAVVTWGQSLIKDASQREILFELDVVREAIFEKYGKTTEFDLLCKNFGNLFRQWSEA